MKEDNKFLIPEIEIIKIVADDIILTSGEGDFSEINDDDIH